MPKTTSPYFRFPVKPACISAPKAVARSMPISGHSRVLSAGFGAAPRAARFGFATRSDEGIPDDPDPPISSFRRVGASAERRATKCRELR